jgi:hypothetical protein
LYGKNCIHLAPQEFNMQNPLTKSAFKRFLEQLSGLKIEIDFKNKVCVHKCQQKLSTAENKRHRDFCFDEVETQLREKPLRGNQTQEFHYSEDKARYKTVTLT